MLPDKIYNALKVTAQYVLPATASLYFGLATIWNLPYSEQIVGSIMALDVFLGSILGISVMQYNKKMALIPSYVQSSMPEVIENKKVPLYLELSNKTYDILYWTVQIALPAVGTLYFALASIWTLPYSEQIVGTIALITTFVGVFLGINTNQYNNARQEIPA